MRVPCVDRRTPVADRQVPVLRGTAAGLLGSGRPVWHQPRRSPGGQGSHTESAPPFTGWGAFVVLHTLPLDRHRSLCNSAHMPANEDPPDVAALEARLAVARTNYFEADRAYAIARRNRHEAERLWDAALASVRRNR